jgi:hypothetical protein
MDEEGTLTEALYNLKTVGHVGSLTKKIGLA